MLLRSRSSRPPTRTTGWPVPPSAASSARGSGVDPGRKTVAVDRPAGVAPASAAPSEGQSARPTPTTEPVALRVLAEDGSARSVSFGALSRATNRFAHALLALGLRRGDGLFVLCPRGEALHIGVLGGLKAGLVVAPLFTAFGPEPLATRLQIAQPRALLTTRSLYRRKLQALRPQLGFLQHVIVIDDDDEVPGSGGGRAAENATPPPAGTLDYHALLAAAPDTPVAARTQAQDPALIHFTSGTTGTPKAALHVHEAALMHWAN